MAKKVAKKVGAPKLSIVEVQANANAAITNRNNHEQAVAWSKDPSKSARERAEAAAEAERLASLMEDETPAQEEAVETEVKEN